MIRIVLLITPLLVLFSCSENFIGDPAKNITPGTTTVNGIVQFPSQLTGSWYGTDGSLVFEITSSSSFSYGSTTYSILKTSVLNGVYKVVTQSNSSGSYFSFFFKDISGSGFSAYRSSSFSTQSDAEGAVEGLYSFLSSGPWSNASFPNALNKSWYSTSTGALTFEISGSSSIKYLGVVYTVETVLVSGTTYRILAKNTADNITPYYGFFFKDILSGSMAAQRSAGGYSLISSVDVSPSGSYQTYSSQAPSPWTVSTFPSGLIKSWNTTAGSLAYTISGSSAITYASTSYAVIAMYKNGTKYKIIVRSPSPSNLYFAFFFDNITASGMTSYRSGSYTTQSAAEAAAEGTHSTYVAASASAWTSISFPSAANGGWYTSSGTLNYLFYRSSSVHWGSTQLTYISAGQNGSTYRIIMKINGGSYYVFFFTSLTSTSANIHVSSAKSTLADAEATVAGTYTAHTALWPLSAFPTSLNGTWLTASNLASYYITNGTMIETNGNSYTISATYKQGSVYKVITTWGSNYQTFYFKDVTSTVMYVYQGFAESSYLTAFNTAQGTYLYHKK